MSTLENLRDHHLKEAIKDIKEGKSLGLNEGFHAAVCELSASSHIKEAKRFDDLFQKELLEQ